MTDGQGATLAKPAPYGHNAAAFDSLVSTGAAEDVIADVAQLYWDDPAGCWDSLAGAQELRCGEKHISVVGVYQYRMGIGGAERVVAEQVRIWKKLGYQVVFFADEPRELSRQTLPDDLIWIELPPSDTCTPTTLRKRAHIIAQAVREHNVDVLVHNQWWNRLLGWDALLFKALGVPVCLVCHSVYMLMFHEANTQEFDHSRIMRYLDGLVVLSEADREFWRKFNPRVLLTNNPVTALPREESRSDLAGKNIVWVGRLSDFDKQPGEALEIMAHVASQVPEATLTIVGAASSRHELERLKALARRLKIADRVVFAEPHGGVASYYQQASVYLITSRLEGWSLTLAESKAFGLPCVMYELDYLTLTRGNRGIVAVPQGDREGAACAICAVLEDEQLRQTLGQAAFDHMKELAAYDLAGFWQQALSELSKGSPDRLGYERADAEWNLLLEGFKDSVSKAYDVPLRSAMKRRALKAARSLWRRARGNREA